MSSSSKKIIGRSQDCDYVIFDPKNRVSRKHLEIINNGSSFTIKDLKSLNGTYVNGNKINPNQEIIIRISDKLTLSKDYTLNLNEVFKNNFDDDSTKILNNIKGPSLAFDNERTILNNGDKTIVFDKNKTSISDLSEIDKTPYITIGRSIDNKIVLDNTSVSKYHCKIRMISPLIVEIEDLGSTNGTFADDNKISPNCKFQYSSSVKIRLASNVFLDLRKIFPNIHIIEKKSPPVNPTPPQQNNQAITAKELNEFMQLEEVWKEYNNRHQASSSSANSYSIGGTILGGVAAIVLGGPVGMAISIGGGILGRYLGQQESNKIKNDHTYDDMFLQVYACPRCKESFQRKPWVTIRDCNKCRIKFR